MDFNKSRPVPSKAALKVLYQLAYISSGTLVGVAALCAEERRRRTQVVQKIADNARRIRQSPRYNHYSAVAAATIDDEHLDFFDSREARRRFRKPKEKLVDDENGALAPYLPSSIAEGYAHLTKQPDPRNRGTFTRIVDDNLLEKKVPRSGELAAPELSRSEQGRSRYTHASFASRQLPRSRRHVQSITPTSKSAELSELSMVAESPVSIAIQSVDTASSSAEVFAANQESSMMKLWRTTQNFELVLDRIDSLERDAKLMGNISNSLQIALKKVDILIEAEQLTAADSALQAIVKSHGTSSSALWLSTVLRAKEKDWPSVYHSLDMLQNEVLANGDVITALSFNKLIHLYATAHDYAHLWKFITRLERQFGFMPDNRTSAIVMAAIVGGHQYELLPAWLDHMKQIGQPLHLHGLYAADLMTRYYHQQRPSADHIRQFCVTLNKSTSNLAGHQYRVLIKTAIGYDMSQQGASVLREKATAARICLTDLEEEFPYVHSQYQGHSKSFEETGSESMLSGNNDRLSRAEVHADMFLALVQGQFERVVQLYHNSLDSEGLPMSISALETAAKASINLHKGDISYAQNLLEQAWERGISRGCGQNILAIHQLQAMSLIEKRNPELVLRRVKRYQDLMRETGRAPVAKVWLVAANLLVRHGQADKGLELLRDFFSTNPAGLQKLNSSAMASFLKGFIAVSHIQGVDWVVKTILEQDIRISESFLRTFRRVLAQIDACVGLEGQVTHDTRSGSAILRATLTDSFHQCKARRELQNRTAVTHGQKLVKSLIDCAKQQDKALLPSEHRLVLDQALFGESSDDITQLDTKVQPGLIKESHEKELDGLKAKLVHEVGLTKVVHRQRRAHGDLLWRLRYRRFYDRDILLADGALACFRYFCPEADNLNGKARFSRQREGED